MRCVRGSSFKGGLKRFPFLRLSLGFDFLAFLPGKSMFPWALEQMKGGTPVLQCSIRHHQMFSPNMRGSALLLDDMTLILLSEFTGPIHSSY